jgi:hypothetical protein
MADYSFHYEKFENFDFFDLSFYKFTSLIGSSNSPVYSYTNNLNSSDQIAVKEVKLPSDTLEFQ